MALYKCVRAAYVGGRLYRPGEQVDGFPGIEKWSKNFKSLDKSGGKTESSDIKRVPGIGMWELPDGTKFKGSKSAAEAAWAKIQGV